VRGAAAASEEAAAVSRVLQQLADRWARNVMSCEKHVVSSK
jgi:hypothetical protein